MDKRFWICGLVVSIAALLLGCVVHAVLLAPDYTALGAQFREAGASRGLAYWIVAAHALLGFAMTWIYAQGFSDRRPFAIQGLRFGLAMALFATIPAHLVQYTLQPLPGALVLKQIAYGMIAMLLLGLLVAWLQPQRKVLAELP